MAAKLEEKTKDYKASILLSGAFYDYLSPEAKRYVRLLDITNNSNTWEPDILSKLL
jgi:hypothetical protein